MFQVKQNWIPNANSILNEVPENSIIISTSKALFRLMELNDWQGACHAISSIFFVLLREQNVKGDLNLIIGEAKQGKYYFNHSWIEFNGYIYDLAIANTSDIRIESAPIIRNINLDTNQITNIEYAVNSGIEDDEPTKIIKNLNLTNYFDLFPFFKNGLWHPLIIEAKNINLDLNLSVLRNKYAQVKWKVK